LCPKIIENKACKEKATLLYSVNGRHSADRKTQKMKAQKTEKMKAETKQEREARFARIKAENRKAGRQPIAVRV